jgi:hypothetical protein
VNFVVVQAIKFVGHSDLGTTNPNFKSVAYNSDLVNIVDRDQWPKILTKFTTILILSKLVELLS